MKKRKHKHQFVKANKQEVEHHLLSPAVWDNRLKTDIKQQDPT